MALIGAGWRDMSRDAPPGWGSFVQVPLEAGIGGGGQGLMSTTTGVGGAMTKDASGSCSSWSAGTVSQPTGLGIVSVESRLEFQGTVTATDMSRATDVREKERMGVFGNTLDTPGAYSRFTSESLGRDLNPLGRGDGNAYVAGWVNLGRVSPALPMAKGRGGQGNSVNNGCSNCGGASPAPSASIPLPDRSKSWIVQEKCAAACAEWHGNDVMYEWCLRCCHSPQDSNCGDFRSNASFVKRRDWHAGFVRFRDVSFGGNDAYWIYEHKSWKWWDKGNQGPTPVPPGTDPPNDVPPPGDTGPKPAPEKKNCETLSSFPCYRGEFNCNGFMLPSPQRFCYECNTGSVACSCTIDALDCALMVTEAALKTGFPGLDWSDWLAWKQDWMVKWHIDSSGYCDFQGMKFFDAWTDLFGHLSSILDAWDLGHILSQALCCRELYTKCIEIGTRTFACDSEGKWYDWKNNCQGGFGMGGGGATIVR